MIKSIDRFPMPSTYFRLVLRELGASSSEISDTKDLGPDHISSAAAIIDVGRQLEQVRALNRVEEPGWGLRMGSLFGASAHGPVGVAVSSADTLAQACEVIIRFGQVRQPFLGLRERRDDDWLGIVIEPASDLEDSEAAPLIDACLVGITALIEQILGRRAIEARYEIASAEPTYVDEYTKHLPGSIEFNADEYCVLIPEDWLGIPSPFADPALHQVAVQRLEILDRDLHPEGLFISRIEQILSSCEARVPTLEEVAESLHVSPRTIERRLGRVGMTFRELSDMRRRTQAEKLLCNTELSIAQVSNQLGYEDPANFGRACRRWFGESPGALRQKLAIED